MGIYTRTLGMVEDGMSSRILAIPTRIPKYDEFVYGTRQGTYYLYGAESGVGKTTFAREKHMYIPYEFYKQVNDPTKLDVHFVDFSLEITAEVNMAAAASRKIYLEHQRILPVAKMMGWDKSGGTISEANLQILHSYRDYFTEFETKLTSVDEDITAVKFHDILMEVCKSHGSFSREGRWVWECGLYTPNNPALFLIAFIDTINLTDTDPENKTIKSTIDKVSRMVVWFRNKCNLTAIVIQQFNADISATDRSRFGVSTPLLRDFEDSKRTTKDANVVFGLYDPSRHLKDGKDTFKGYDITILKSWFRSLHLLKHRNGQTNKFIPLKFNGLAGVFDQLPDALAMTPEEYVIATRI